jgi:hypothetical protein
MSDILRTGCNRYISNWIQSKLTHKGMRFGVLTTVNIKTAVFRNVMPCSWYVVTIESEKLAAIS